VTADVTSLASLTRRTGGRVVPAYDSNAEEFKKIPDRSLPVLKTQPEELWNKPFALVLVVLIATGEWLLRKSAGLI